MNNVNLATYILAVCAVVVVGLLIRKEFFLNHKPLTSEPIRYIGKMDTLDLGGIQIGSKDAEVTIIEFFDYQCPSCRKFKETVDYIVKNFKNQIKVWYVHLPLSYHHNAFEAALVAECANRQDRFLVAHDYLFQNQKRLSSLNWRTLAEKINIPNTRKFMRCIENEETATSVNKGLSAGIQFHVSAIPTILINGNMYKGAIPPEQLKTLVQLELE